MQFSSLTPSMTGEQAAMSTVIYEDGTSEANPGVTNEYRTADAQPKSR